MAAPQSILNIFFVVNIFELISGADVLPRLQHLLRCPRHAPVRLQHRRHQRTGVGKDAYEIEFQPQRCPHQPLDVVLTSPSCPHQPPDDVLTSL